ncbi:MULTISPECIES: TerD family protein [Pseudomonas]|uniref:TerD family protein n=2 Tax=Pseudomonas farsensis TaxID=2745492 RepID=A0ABU8QWJ0_9PSED|nr:MULTISPECIES: TerD family protein [Pseudomonas]MBC3413071.1 TerD family protein [Pseudomonas sp. SWRI51]MBV4534078.1 TerD family protein [Pseudomonas farsensis]
MTTLGPGANAAVGSGNLRVEVVYTPIPGVDLDVSAFALAATGKVRSDNDMCFYGQPSVLGGAVQLLDSAAGRAAFSINLANLDASIEKIALTATLYENKASFDRVSSLSVSVSGGIEAQIPTAGMKETALILGEFYLRQGQWKFRCVAQGFAGGLAPLATHFGVDVAAPAPSAAPAPAPAPAPVATPAPPPAPKPSVSLSKVTLDKTRTSISLEKSAGGFGEIRVNLNWNKGKAGFFGRGKSIDLDVGCLYELQDGEKGCVQALGNAFGALNHEPFVQLMGDDRTGAVAGGEWLHINGSQWNRIRRILVYAFIYEGAPNWRETDGVVTIFVPGQAEIEVRLNEEGGSLGCCAIALLENDNGSVKVTRRVDFHRSQKPMDEAYRWGMNWGRGSK